MTALGRQSIPKRIDALKAHLKTRRGRRDQTALKRLAELVNYLKGCTTLASYDDLLKAYYNLENDNPLYRENPFFAMISKAKTDLNVPDGRAYIVPAEFPMSRIIEEEVDAPIRSKTSKTYRDMYDTIDWGDRPVRGENDSEPAEPGDAIECTLKTYANVVAPLEAQFPVETYTPQIGDQCPLCETRTPIQTIDHDERIFECSDRVHSFDEL